MFTASTYQEQLPKMRRDFPESAKTKMVDNSRSSEERETDQTSSDVIRASLRNAISSRVTLPTVESVLYQMICDKPFLHPVCELCYRKISKHLAEECGADINIDYCDSTETVSPTRRESISNYGVLMIKLLIQRRAIAWDGTQDISCIHFLHDNKYYILLYIRMLKDERNNRSSTHAEMLRAAACVVVISRYRCQDYAQIKNKVDFLKAAATGDIDHMKAYVAEGLPDTENALYLAMLNGQENVESLLINNEPINLKEYVKLLELCGARFIIFASEKQKGLECWRKSLEIRRVFRLQDSDENSIKPKMDLGIKFRTTEDIDLLQFGGDWNYSIQGLLVFLQHFSSSSKLAQNAFEVVAEQYLFEADLFRPLTILSELFYFPHMQICPPSKCALHAMEKLFHYRFSRYIGDKTVFLNRFRTLFELLNNPIWSRLLSVAVEFQRVAYEELLALVVMNIDYMFGYDFNIEEKTSIGNEIRKLTDTCTPPYETTLLHKAIKMKSSLPIVAFIIEYTNDVNCRDASNCTPLHLVARLRRWDPYLHYMANVLIDAGGHVDCVDSSGGRPLEALIRKGVIHNPLDNLSLQCLAAGAISTSGIIVPERNFPKILARFIRLHSNS